MRIARIIEYFLPHVGGMERHAFSLTQEQIKAGHQVDLYIGYGDKNLLPNMRKMPFQFLLMYSKIRRLWFNAWAYRQIRKQHKKSHYDIIHLHGDFIEAYFGGKLSKKLSIPAVITIHAGLNKRFLKPKNAQYFKNIGKIICVSEEIKGDLEKIGIPKEKITVISSGVYLFEFNNADENKISELRNQYSKPILISVGVLRTSKGHKYLIGAYKQLKQKYTSLSLIIIGDGPEKNNLEREAKGLDQVYFLGRQNHCKIVEYMKVADIFVS